MATGDKQDILDKLKAALPSGWFTEDHMVTVLLSGFSEMGAYIYSLIQGAALQARIKTATDFLDLIAGDFFGNGLIRKPGESHPSYRTRIYANLFRERATRSAVTKILTDVTGTPPLIFEPRRSMDTGGYNTGSVGYNTSGAGAYGNPNLPYQAFITAYRPSGAGIPDVGGYGSSVGGYSVPSRLRYADLAESRSNITDLDIYGAVEAVRPVGTVLWVQIRNIPVAESPGNLLPIFIFDDQMQNVIVDDSGNYVIQ